MSASSRSLRPGRRERAKADKRSRILEAARALLDQKGYGGMTMARVAGDADVAIGTVFQYAAGKAELLMMVTAERWAAWAERADHFADASPAPAPGPRPDADPVDAIVDIVTPLLDEAAERPEITMAIARELLFGADGPHRRDVLDLVATVERAVADIVREAGGGDAAPAAARLVVSGVLVELNLTRTGVHDRRTLEERVREVVGLAVAGAVHS